MLIRNSYEPPGHSLKLDGKKVQGLIDEFVRALQIDNIMDQREVTYDNFLGYAAKFKTERARTALIKNKARQIIVNFLQQILLTISWIPVMFKMIFHLKKLN
jgi:hypothetical protein